MLKYTPILEGLWPQYIRTNKIARNFKTVKILNPFAAAWLPSASVARGLHDWRPANQAAFSRTNSRVRQVSACPDSTMYTRVHCAYNVIKIPYIRRTYVLHTYWLLDFQ